MEPSELLKGLQPRSDAPRCEEIAAERLRSVDHLVVDCDGLLWNMHSKEAVESSAERYLTQNAAARASSMFLLVYYIGFRVLLI